MKFKENLSNITVIDKDNIEKILDADTISTCVELEKTIQEFWNIDRASANFLNMLIKMKNIKSALEVGTSNGYSAIWIAKALLETGGKLTTIEYWQKRMDLALDNFKKTGVDKIITPIVGDAVEVLADMKKDNSLKFDFIFLDANKEEYIDYFKSIDSLLSFGGVIVADNILSHYKKTKNYVEEITNNPNYQSQLLNFEAGMMLSFKNPNLGFKKSE